MVVSLESLGVVEVVLMFLRRLVLSEVFDLHLNWHMTLHCASTGAA